MKLLACLSARLVYCPCSLALSVLRPSRKCSRAGQRNGPQAQTGFFPLVEGIGRQIKSDVLGVGASSSLQLVVGRLARKTSHARSWRVLCSLNQGRAIFRVYGDACAGRPFQLPSRLRGDPSNRAVPGADPVHAPAFFVTALSSAVFFLLYLVFQDGERAHRTGHERASLGRAQAISRFPCVASRTFFVSGLFEKMFTSPPPPNTG